MHRLLAMLMAVGLTACGSDTGTAGSAGPGSGPPDVTTMTSASASASASASTTASTTTVVAVPPGGDPAGPTFDGPPAPLVVPLLVLDDPDVPPMSAASTASEIVDEPYVSQSAASRTFVRAGSPHDGDQGPRVMFAVLALPDDMAASPPDPRSRVVDVDGRSMTVTPETEDSIAVEATTIDGTPFGLGSLNVPEAELLELAADVIWDGDRFSFASGDVPPGWLDTGTILAALSFVAGASGTSTPAGGARITYGAIPSGGMTHETDAVTLTTWTSSAPDPMVEARYYLGGKQERIIDIGGVATTVYTGSNEFLNYAVWNDAGQWIALSSPSRTVDELTTFAPNVRPADPTEIAAINALAN